VTSGDSRPTLGVYYIDLNCSLQMVHNATRCTVEQKSISGRSGTGIFPARGKLLVPEWVVT
jgi:hypothetical protein